MNNIMISKKELKDGKYYQGHCRNTKVALWVERKEEFVYIRFKIGYAMDTIKHFEDVKDTHQDGFIPIKEIEDISYQTVNEIKEKVGY